jgi:hypothetical protein
MSAAVVTLSKLRDTSALADEIAVTLFLHNRWLLVEDSWNSK